MITTMTETGDFLLKMFCGAFLFVSLMFYLVPMELFFLVWFTVSIATVGIGIIQIFLLGMESIIMFQMPESHEDKAYSMAPGYQSPVMPNGAKLVGTEIRRIRLPWWKQTVRFLRGMPTYDEQVIPAHVEFTTPPAANAPLIIPYETAYEDLPDVMKTQRLIFWVALNPTPNAKKLYIEEIEDVLVPVRIKLMELQRRPGTVVIITLGAQMMTDEQYRNVRAVQRKGQP